MISGPLRIDVLLVSKQTDVDSSLIFDLLVLDSNHKFLIYLNTVSQACIECPLGGSCSFGLMCLLTTER